MTQYECVSCLVIAIIVAFVVVIHVQCLVSVYLSLVKIKSVFLTNNLRVVKNQDEELYIKKIEKFFS